MYLFRQVFDEQDLGRQRPRLRCGDCRIDESVTVYSVTRKQVEQPLLLVTTNRMPPASSCSQRLLRDVAAVRRIMNVCRTQQYIAAVTEIMNKLHQGSIFSFFDFTGSFRKIPVHPDTTPLTACATPVRLFEWLKIPVGASKQQ